LAVAGPGADGLRPLPRRRTLDVALPERPRPALRRADGVDGAAPGAVVEDAVAVGLLAERPPAARLAGVQRPHLLDRLAEELGDRREFVVGDPDESRFAGAALAAAGAGERQPVLV